MNAATTAYVDQLDAAIRDAAQIARTIAGQLGRTQHRADVPAALEALVKRHDVLMMLGCGLACRHVDLAHPAPRYATGWYPGRVTCWQCAWRLDSSPENEHRCDLCGANVPGELELVVAQVGLTVLTAGLCQRCMSGDVG